MLGPSEYTLGPLPDGGGLDARTCKEYQDTRSRPEGQARFPRTGLSTACGIAANWDLENSEPGGLEPHTGGCQRLLRRCSPPGEFRLRVTPRGARLECRVPGWLPLTWLRETVSAARSLMGTAGLLGDLFSRRGELHEAEEVLKSVDERDRDRVLREAQLAYVRHESEFRDVRGRSDLVRAWTGLLIEATHKVARDRVDADRYAAVTGGKSGDAWASASAIAARERWKDGHLPQMPRDPSA